MNDDHPRDFVGYGARPPHPRWPRGARLALNFVLNVEEGSEASVPDGDGRSEIGLTESPLSPVSPGGRDLAAESMFEYGSRAGFWRLMRVFDRFELPMTVFACARALERNPQAAEAIRRSGHDVCCHGLRWIEHFHLSEEEERAQMLAAIESIEATIGERPRGWYCRYGPSENTRRLLVEEGGFVYDSDAYNDDLPYWTRVSGEPHLVVPYSLANNDAQFKRGNWASGDDLFRFIVDAVHFLRHEGSESPKMMSVGMHSRLLGHPGRAAGLARLLEHLKGLDDVWICRRIEIARHWIRHHPPPADG